MMALFALKGIGFNKVYKVQIYCITHAWETCKRMLRCVLVATYIFSVFFFLITSCSSRLFTASRTKKSGCLFKWSSWIYFTVGCQFNVCNTLQIQKQKKQNSKLTKPGLMNISLCCSYSYV